MGQVKMATVAVFCTITTQFRFYWSSWPYKHRFRLLIYSVLCIIGWTTIKIRKFSNGGTNLHITPTWDTFTAWEHSLSFSTHFFLSEKFSEILVSRGCRRTHFPTKLSLTPATPQNCRFQTVITSLFLDQFEWKYLICAPFWSKNNPRKDRSSKQAN